MVNKCFVLCEEVIDIFNEKLHYHNRKSVISYFSCQDSWFNEMWEYWRYFPALMHQRKYKVKNIMRKNSTKQLV